MKAFDCTDIMGEYVMGQRDRRGDCFLKLLYAFDHCLSHAYVKGFDTKYTCVSNGRSDRRQIDYVATAPRSYIAQAKVAEATAALSDHWPLSIGLLARQIERALSSRGEASRIPNQLGGS